MKKLIIALILALIAGISTYVVNHTEPTVTAQEKGYQQAYCTRVVDGDTIVVKIGLDEFKVRYIGIDTPETVDPNRPIGFFGKEASQKNKELVLAKDIKLEKDVSDADKYGRLLRYIYLDGVMINAELVRLGYAKAATYPPDVKYASLFVQMEREARDNNRGLWAK
jgi:micrococcal nuclease